MKKVNNIRNEINTENIFSNPIITVDNCLIMPIELNVVKYQDFMPSVNNHILNSNNKFEYLDLDNHFIDLSSNKITKIVNNYYEDNKQIIDEEYLKEKLLQDLSLNQDEYKYHYYYTRKGNLQISKDKENKPIKGSYFTCKRMKKYNGEYYDMYCYISNPKSKIQLTSNNLKILPKLNRKNKVIEWLKTIKDDRNILD